MKRFVAITAFTLLVFTENTSLFARNFNFFTSYGSIPQNFSMPATRPHAESLTIKRVIGQLSIIDIAAIDLYAGLGTVVHASQWQRETKHLTAQLRSWSVEATLAITLSKWQLQGGVFRYWHQQPGDALLIAHRQNKRRNIRFRIPGRWGAHTRFTRRFLGFIIVGGAATIEDWQLNNKVINDGQNALQNEARVAVSGSLLVGMTL